MKFPALGWSIPARPGIHPDGGSAADIADRLQRRARCQGRAGGVRESLDAGANGAAGRVRAHGLVKPVEVEHECLQRGAKVGLAVVFPVEHCGAATTFLGAVAGGHDVAGKHALVEMAELQRVLDRSLPAAILACGGLCPGHGGPPRVAGKLSGRAGLEPAMPVVPAGSGRGSGGRPCCGNADRAAFIAAPRLGRRRSPERNSRLDLDALAPRLAVPVAGRLGIICPDDIEVRLILGVARAQHVGEVDTDAGPDTVFFEPGEARPEVGAAPALDRDLVGQVGAGVFGGVLHRGVDLEEDDALRLKLGRDLAKLGPERRQGRRRQRARGVDDDGDRVDALRADRGQVEARVDEAPVGQAPTVIALRGVGHVAAEEASASRRCSHARRGRSPRRRPAACPGPSRGSPPGAWPRPMPALPRQFRPETKRRCSLRHQWARP